MRGSRFAGLCLGSVLLSIAPLAHAQGATRGQSGFVESAPARNGDYNVEFDEDPLLALDPNEFIARIQVRPGAARTMLLRPRTSFVSQLLKSIEAI